MGTLQSIPITLQSVELVIACIKHCNPTTREIRSVDGRIICSLKPNDIEKCFDIPPCPTSKVISVTECDKAFEAAKSLCQGIMIEKSLKVKKAYLPKLLGRGECKDEYAVLITLLNRIIGQEDGNQFQSWMYYVIAKIISKREHYNWATLISDTFHHQITRFLEAHRFDMCSYLVCLIAFQGEFRILNNAGTLGVQKVHEHFTRLEFTQAERHVKRTSDHFIMHTVRDLDHEMHARISQTAREAMTDWADWFIQFPTFSYIRVYGYIGHLAMMPQYPSDRVVFMEFLRQLSKVHTHLLLKKKTTVNFLVKMGLYRCRLTVDAKLRSQETVRHNLKYLIERRSYDPRGLYAAHLEQHSSHKSSLEDYWVNCDDEYEVRRRNYSRFRLSQIADFILEDIEGLSDDEGEVVLPSFFVDSVDSQPLPKVDWYAKDNPSIEERTSRVVRNSQLYLDSKKTRKVVPPRTEPPQVQSTPPSTSRKKPKQKQWCNPPQGMRMSKHRRPRTLGTHVETTTHSPEIVMGIAASEPVIEIVVEEVAVALEPTTEEATT